MSVDYAIKLYHDLLTSDVAAETSDELVRLQKLRGLAFGKRPLSTVLRPRFLTPVDYRFMRQRVGTLMQAFAIAHKAAIENPSALSQFGLTDQEKQLIVADPGFKSPMPTSRLDAFFVSQDEFKFTEYNAETPAATAYGDAIAEVFLALPVMRKFAKRYSVLPMPTRPGVLQALLECYRQWRGVREKPRIAIVDWEEVPTYSEFVLFREYFTSLGFECIIVDPRKVEYKNGNLMAGDYHINLIYKRVLIGELIERGGMDHPIVRAVQDRAVCMVNPFRAKILYKKASFAVLTDERNAGWFDNEQKAAIAAHIPWTRTVEERNTQFEGKAVDLIPFITENRDRLVLKPNDDYGGAGITLGWTVDGLTWEKALQDALTKPYVVQEKVGIPSEPFPTYVDGKLEIYDRMLDTAPFVWQGEYMDGCLTRISTAALLNVTAGGGSTVPTFLIETRT